MLFRSDRKSTRLNSSHLVISYAVFCLKKKKTPACVVPVLRRPLRTRWTVSYHGAWRGRIARDWLAGEPEVGGKLVNLFFFFFNDTATTEIYTLSLHDALPISVVKSDTAAGNARSSVESNGS